MSNERWFSTLILILILGLVLRSPFLTALSISLLFIFGLAYWWQKHSLDGVDYKRKFRYSRAFPGESYPVKVEIENHKLLPLTWLRVQDPWPRAVGPTDEDVLAPSHSQDQGFLTQRIQPALVRTHPQNLPAVIPQTWNLYGGTGAA